MVERLPYPIERLLWSIGDTVAGVHGDIGPDLVWTDPTWRPLLMAANEAAWPRPYPDVLRDLAIGFTADWRHALESIVPVARLAGGRSFRPF